MIAVLSETAGGNGSAWRRRNPSVHATVIEEVLRLRSAATSIGRQRYSKDVRRSPASFFPKDSSSDRLAPGPPTAIPAEFPRADEFAVDENRSGVQIAFGQGAHHWPWAQRSRVRSCKKALIALSPPDPLSKARSRRRVICRRSAINGPTKLPISYTGALSLCAALNARAPDSRKARLEDDPSFEAVEKKRGLWPIHPKTLIASRTPKTDHRRRGARARAVAILG